MTFWRLLTNPVDRKSEPENWPTITPHLPELQRAVRDPKVIALVQETLTTIESFDSAKTKTREKLVQNAIFIKIQGLGAKLAQAVDDNNILEAEKHATALATLMEACGGGSICPVHEPYLARYLGMAAKLK